MGKNYFEIIRAGINTTFQDKGRSNLYHIGIPFSGAMDNRNYQLANRLVGNKLDLPVIEFAYQGPLLRFYGDKINIAIAGDFVGEPWNRLPLAERLSKILIDYTNWNSVSEMEIRNLSVTMEDYVV